jgi:acetyl-CoA acetyltransferase
VTAPHRRPPAGAAIAGLGMTELGKVYGRSSRRLAAEAVRLAVADAGLELLDLDGLLVCPGIAGGVLDVGLAQLLGLRDLRLLSVINSYGASAGAAVALAALAVTTGSAATVACVFADTPLRPSAPAGATFGLRGRAASSGASGPSGASSPSAASGPSRASGRPGASGASGASGADLAEPRPQWHGLLGLAAGLGYRTVTAEYALAARRHMAAFGTTSEQFAAVAVAQRAWAAGNPRAQLREPLTVAGHQASRWIVKPLHLLDCCLVSNGSVAVVVTRADRAAGLRRPPVHVWGWGQGHPGHQLERGSEFGLRTGAAIAGPAAMAMAGIAATDVTMCQIYDCYTYTVVVTLEDYGFCAKGEGGPFAASGALAPGGSLPVNTGGGQLSSYYMWGFTPLSEAVIQARGDGGERQAPGADVILVSGNGGILAHHSTLILSPHAR